MPITNFCLIGLNIKIAAQSLQSDEIGYDGLSPGAAVDHWSVLRPTILENTETVPWSLLEGNLGVPK